MFGDVDHKPIAEKQRNSTHGIGIFMPPCVLKEKLNVIHDLLTTVLLTITVTRCGQRLKYNRFVALNHYTVLQMVAQRLGQYCPLNIAAQPHQVIFVATVTHADNILLNDWPLV
jgi:hypothetical protein